MSLKKTQPLVVRRKPKVRSSGDRTEGVGTAIVLNRRTPQGSPLRLGALSWGIVDSWRQSPEEFLASLTVAARLFESCDLAVAAGLTVTTPPQPQAVLTASAGTPVLFEVDTKGGDRSWLLAHCDSGSPQVALLRQRQLVEKYDHYEGFGLLADAIAAEAGVISFEGTDLRLILFICGENNLLAPDAARSVFKRVPNEPTSAGRLRELLGGPWLMRNPAHAPYYPPIRSTGFAKVGVVRFEGGQAGPTLRRLVEHEGRYRDGSLFQKNVRQSLGLSNAVNKGIKATIYDNGGDFFFYHNGVTAICNQMTLTDDGTFKVKGLSVVNGCQSLNTILSCSEKVKTLDNAFVMFRFYEIPQRERADRISVSTNSQSPVKPRDLRSNDKRVLGLKKLYEQKYPQG